MTKLETSNANDAKSMHMAIHTDIWGLGVHTTNTNSAHTTHEVVQLASYYAIVRIWQ